MPSTTAIGLRYPVSGDTPDVPRDMKNLADDVTALTPRVAATAGALPSGLPAGSLCWQTDIARMMVYNGSAWEYSRGYYALSAGQVSLGTIGANAGVSVTVTYPVSRFSQTPMMVAMASNNGFTATSAASLSNTSASVKVYNPTASSQAAGNVQWIAVQMTQASGAG